AGRGLIVVVNKWDLAEKDDKAAAKFQKETGEKAPFMKFVPFVFTSALTGQRVSKILELVLEVEEQRLKRVPTSEVNEVLHVLRVLGPRVGLLVFAVDIAKGAIPVRFLPPLTTTNPETRVWIAVACGVAAILGHIRPVFLKFGKGGKGVATACGVFLALAPIQ